MNDHQPHRRPTTLPTAAAAADPAVTPTGRPDEPFDVHKLADIVGDGWVVELLRSHDRSAGQQPPQVNMAELRARAAAGDYTPLSRRVRRKACLTLLYRRWSGRLHALADRCRLQLPLPLHGNPDRDCLDPGRPSAPRTTRTPANGGH
ncbi:hypothetical protein [Hamadaea tsunoensis]|uniref:hypothetical protein n=1 Tax=Hamadaea tsunoensis TaxID=53368 RepID=UPI00040A2314|nr:hypothetical protein [Hamadaea tsunoensis]